MNYSNDIKEIISFIFSSLSFERNDYEECLNRFTAYIDEEFLQQRAQAIKESIKVNQDLKTALSLLAFFCNGHFDHCDVCPVRKYCNTYIDNVRNNADAFDYSMVDLFCGAGGLSLGFTQEGFNTALANDIDECCIDTYSHNHPGTPRSHIILGDIKDVTKNLDSYLAGKRIDVVIGGPPCQGFSMANRQRLIDDPRNNLYKSFVEVVQKINPPFFVMENVKGMLSVADQVKEDFKNIGYDVECKILNAKDYGVPQNRERLIYIGTRTNANINDIFNELQELSKTIPEFTLGDALYGLRELKASRIKNATDLGSEESGFIIERNSFFGSNDYIGLINKNIRSAVICNHKARYNNDRDIEIFGRMEPGDKSDDPKIADIMPYSRRNDIFKDKYYKLSMDKICKTITAHMKFDCNMYIHPTQARGLTPREAARVQSYPDDYYFRGAYTKTYMQIGNSVPPLLGRAIASIVKQYIKLS